MYCEAEGLTRSEGRLSDDPTFKERLCAVFKRYPIVTGGVFGSVARMTDRPDSDLDVFAQFDHDPSYDEIRSCGEEISREFGRPVDLLTTYEGTTLEFRYFFKRDKVTLYAR